MSASFWPYVKSFHGKKSSKGEDFILVCEDTDDDKCGDPSTPSLCSWGVSNNSPCVRFSLYGIFDGHGGQSSASFCTSKDGWFVKSLKSALSRRASGDPVNKSNAAHWSNHLAAALKEVFEEANDICCERFCTSGTTATVVVVSRFSFDVEEVAESCRYALITVANVGDSHAFLDHGGGARRMNDDHRLDSNASERTRVEKEGGQIRQYKGEPRRLWPGGLMMSRTIGDADAKQACATPCVISAWVPLAKGRGARVIVASDGLWDTMKGSEACTLVRKKKAQASCAASYKECCEEVRQGTSRRYILNCRRPL